MQTDTVESDSILPQLIHEGINYSKNKALQFRNIGYCASPLPTIQPHLFIFLIQTSYQ